MILSLRRCNSVGDEYGLLSQNESFPPSDPTKKPGSKASGGDSGEPCHSLLIIDIIYASE